MTTETKYNIFFFIICLIVTILSIYVAFSVLKDNGEKGIKFCDEKYGINNWYFKDITGTKEAKELYGWYYIGQVWVCKQYGDVK